jgi:hypothetical protein
MPSRLRVIARLSCGRGRSCRFVLVRRPLLPAKAVSPASALDRQDHVPNVESAVRVRSPPLACSSSSFPMPARRQDERDVERCRALGLAVGRTHGHAILKKPHARHSLVEVICVCNAGARVVPIRRARATARPARAARRARGCSAHLVTNRRVTRGLRRGVWRWVGVVAGGGVGVVHRR